MDYTPHWLTVALKYVGVRETPGPTTTPIIRRWAAALSDWWRGFFADDGLPWCALFVNAVFFECGMAGTGTLRARDWLTWGDDIGRPPALGAVLVFERPGGGHVGFYVGETAEAYRVLGGNQGDAVSLAWIAKARCIGVRWPKNYMLSRRGVLLAATGEPVSINES